MTLKNNVYDTTALLGVMRDNSMMQPPSNYWLSLGYTSVIQFDTEEVEFSKIQENRKIAPLVVPTSQGVPIYSSAEERDRTSLGMDGCGSDDQGPRHP